MLGRVPSTTPALLRGFSRHSITGRHYPIIFHSPNTIDTVKGKILHNISTDETKILDSFEGDEYERIEVVLQNVDDGKEMKAFTYIATKDTHQQLLSQLTAEWDYENFRANNLKPFLEMCFGFMETGKEFK